MFRLTSPFSHSRPCRASSFRTSSLSHCVLGNSTVVVVTHGYQVRFRHLVGNYSVKTCLIPIAVKVGRDLVFRATEHVVLLADGLLDRNNNSVNDLVSSCDTLLLNLE